jgi:hypothetical protein
MSRKKFSNAVAPGSSPRLGTAEDVALAANIGVRSIPKLIEDGLPVVFLSPNRKRFDVPACVAWLKQRFTVGGSR